MTEADFLRNRPVFICGHPKAGTSLVRAIFDSHPQLIVYPEESVFFRRFLPQAAALSLEEQLGLAERTLIHIFRWNQDHPLPDQQGFPDRDYSSIPYERVRQLMRQTAMQNYRHPGDILSAAVLAFGEVSGQMTPATCWWVEKSPYNEYFADQIFSWWPEARCIHILRDPRDNFASYQRKHPDWQAEFFAANWLRSTRAGMKNRDRYGPDRYTILRYEDLTRDPQTYLPALKDFLQIEMDASLFSPTRAGERWQGNSMFANRFQEISAEPVARWKEKISPVDAAVIETKSASVMEAFGYSASSAKNIILRIAAHWRWITWPLRRKFKELAKRRTT